MTVAKTTWKDSLYIYGPLMLVVAAGFFIAFKYMKPAPPGHIVIATGEANGGYHRFARQYQDYMAKEGITLEIVATQGSVDNINRLRRGEVDIAFVQGGTAPNDAQNLKLESLASLYYEPLWLFHKVGLQLDRVGELPGLQVAVGAETSGTFSLTSLLLSDNKINHSNVTWLSLDANEAVQKLQQRQIDAAFFVSSPNSGMINQLLHSDQIQLASFERARAYARRHHFLKELILPEGAEDLEKNIPDRDIHLLGTTATLVAKEDLHPAIVGLILQAASETHGKEGLFENMDEFPSPRYLEFPLNKQADHFFKKGPPFLQRYLPFWAASLLDRMKIMVLPLLALMFPMFKIMPPLYRWRMRSRIYRWYDQLESLDMALINDPDADMQALRKELSNLDMEVRAIKVPLSFSEQLYHLRQHIQFVQQNVEQEYRRMKKPHESGG
jgi:TRAP transporter TAXI family solute receptor